MKMSLAAAYAMKRRAKSGSKKLEVPESQQESPFKDDEEQDFLSWPPESREDKLKKIVSKRLKYKKNEN